MDGSNSQTYQIKIKSGHGDEVVDGLANSNLAGKKYHFIGAGGVGMSGLAQLLIRSKSIVSGSDQFPSSVTEELRKSGADIKIGHNEDNLAPDTDAVIISAAIPQDNPELRLARQRGCKIYKYAQMLGVLCNRYEGVAVAGTHGKSTASGWLVYCLKQAGIDTNFVIGAEVTQLGTSSGTANSKHFVVEACEYDRSFLNLKPKIACILNIEADHLDCYKDEAEIVDTFSQFALNVKNDGMIIANGTDANVAKVLRQIGADINYDSFGFDEGCNFYARNIELIDGLYAFDVYYNGQLLGATRISLPGRHNILNALAVVAMAVNMGSDAKAILEVLPEFTGIDRRLMLKGRFSQITVIDDYAHHPTEIRASLEAIRQRYQPRRIWCVFQPHQYSRTRFLLEDFAESFRLADITIVPEIYFVRDSQAVKKEVNSQMLVERIQANRTEAMFIESFEAICDYLKSNVINGDLVVTMGAGTIWKVADEYIHWLRGNS